ncbi:MAG: ParB/RepB/Spo0J family partition protein, partial [Bacteroidota bacterium]
SYTQAQVADRVGKNRTTVTNMLRLLSLPDFIQAALKKEEITNGHARALLAVEATADQQRLLSKVIKEGWSVRQIEEAIRALGTKNISKTVSSAVKDPFYDEISSRLRRTFGTKVNVKPKKDGGEIKIEYYSEDDLERILQLLDSVS